MRSRRCIVCLRNWPCTKAFFECPVCEEPTRYSRERAMSFEEANRLASRAEFERRYGVPVEVDA